jgi:hypothetical protein
MTAALADRWSDFWFRPVTSRGVHIARLLLSINALWVVLSRPDWPDLFAWPPELWAGAGTSRLRYLYFSPATTERILYWVLCLCLVAVIVNVGTRLFAFAAGLLLYHFAPLEHVIAQSVGPYFGGLTVPLLGFLILAAAPRPAKDRSVRSPDHRWPLALIQMLFAFTYVLAGLAKLRFSGFGWMSADNMRSTIEVFNSFEPADRPVARFLVEHPALCGALAVATVAMELTFPLILFSRRAAQILVPLVFAGHVGIYLTLGVVFLNLPLVLIFVDWDAVSARLRLFARTRGTAEETAAHTV